MSYSLSLRPRALAEIETARSAYAHVEHGDTFRIEVEAVFDAIQAMPLRFPIVYASVHRALLKRYPFAVYFRIRPNTEHVIVIAVLPQRADPTRWPRR